jgi:hypothetical protein
MSNPSFRSQNDVPGRRLCVLNAGGRDPAQDFPDGAGRPDDPVAPHPPINHHAYAACTHGSFCASTAAALAQDRPILLLLRRDLGASLRVLRRVRAAGSTVAVAFKEAGAVQVAARIDHAAELRSLRSILEHADGFIAPTAPLHVFLDSLLHSGGGPGRATGAFIPTPYPVDDPRWDFSRPVAERRGIFIGTREFAAPARQHLAAILAALELHRLTQEPVTVINTEGHQGARLLTDLGFSAAPATALRFLEGPLRYTAYLREMAGHRLVFQLDRSGVPGQVAGDALLCRVPCVGGDGAVEQIAFPDLAGHDKGPRQLVEIAAALLSDVSRYETACREAEALALERLSFPAVAAQLAEFYATLEKNRRL